MITCWVMLSHQIEEVQVCNDSEIVLCITAIYTIHRLCNFNFNVIADACCSPAMWTCIPTASVHVHYVICVAWNGYKLQDKTCTFIGSALQDCSAELQGFYRGLCKLAFADRLTSQLMDLFFLFGYLTSCNRASNSFTEPLVRAWYDVLVAWAKWFWFCILVSECCWYLFLWFFGR